MIHEILEFTYFKSNLGLNLRNISLLQCENWLFFVQFFRALNSDKGIKGASNSHRRVYFTTQDLQEDQELEISKTYQNTRIKIKKKTQDSKSEEKLVKVCLQTHLNIFDSFQFDNFFFQGKLDGYRNDRDKGKELNADQKAAITKYDEVIQNLDFARNLQQEFNKIIVEEERASKKKSKKEAVERAKFESGRLATILTFQKMLLALAKPKVLEEFKSGDNKLKLSKDQFQDLEEFVQLVSKVKSLDENDKENVALAEHLISLAEAKPKKAVGKTSYKDFHDTLNNMKKSGFNFEEVRINFSWKWDLRFDEFFILFSRSWIKAKLKRHRRRILRPKKSTNLKWWTVTAAKVITPPPLKPPR